MQFWFPLKLQMQLYQVINNENDAAGQWRLINLHLNIIYFLIYGFASDCSSSTHICSEDGVTMWVDSHWMHLIAAKKNFHHCRSL